MSPRRSARRALLLDDPIQVDGGVAELPGDDTKCPIPEHEIQPWFEMSVCDHPIRFGFVDEAVLTSANDGVAVYALTWAELGIVVFDRSLKKNRTQLEVVLLHELLHVGLGAAYGSSTVVSKLFGARTDSQHHDREEGLASYYSDKMARPMVLAKLFRLPKIPR